MIKKGFVVILVAVVAIQFYPVDRTNPAITSEVEVDEEVMQILRRSCYDCHSNETVWPWYSYIAPISWLVADDVHEAREHLNFSEWDKYDLQQRQHKLEELVEEVDAGEMPLKKYVFMHPGTEVSDDEVNVLKSWAELYQMPGIN
ncbi:MAG: heme-binding domain-containing protein [bacterium]